jgi:hypothetical protein
VKNHRAILYFDGEGQIQMDYEGTGYRQQSFQGGGKVGFKAMHLNHWTDKDIHNEKWVDASFEGEVVISGEGDRNVRIDLRIDNKVPFEIQTMGITPKVSQKASEPVSHNFSPGHHELHIEGAISEYYEKQ